MGKLTLILGGARSGKSSKAVRVAQKDRAGQVLFVATAGPGDEEMRTRIEKHRAERPQDWRTLETPHGVGQAVRRQPGVAPDSGGQTQPGTTIIVDCITLLVSNLIADAPDPFVDEVKNRVGLEITEIVQAAQELDCHLIVVSNEVGAGLTPVTPLGRAYRDLLGQANQTLAAAADIAILMVAGLPVILKGPPASARH